MTIRSAFSRLLVMVLFSSGLTACFTGVEGTGKISINKKESEMLKTEENNSLISDITSSLLKDWQIGKKFIVTDSKINVLLKSEVLIQPGDTLLFDRIQKSTGADGEERVDLIFSKGNTPLIYSTEKKENDALNSLSSSDIPMLVDASVIKKVEERLLGKNVWTRTLNWYDAEGVNLKKGKKFQKVTISEVKSGNSFFPIFISFIDDNGETGSLYLNLGNSPNDSRSFGRLFSVTDPRHNYRHISEENWKAIQTEQLRKGMTKEEARLSLGNPSEVDSGHDYSTVMEIWSYPSGRYLRFIDGLLVDFK